VGVSTDTLLARCGAKPYMLPSNGADISISGGSMMLSSEWKGKKAYEKCDSSGQKVMRY
jgi:hypothetical protein